MISQLVPQEQLDIHLHHALQLEQDLQDLKLEQEQVHLTQALRFQPVELRIQALKAHQQLVLHTQQLVNLNDQLDLLLLNALQLSLALNKDLVLLNKDLVQEALDLELKGEAAAVDHHHQANKTRAKKEIIQPFPENQKLITQSSQKSLKLHSTATNRNSQDIMLMSKPVVKSSIFVL